MSLETAKIAYALRGEVSKLVDQANQLGIYVAGWYHGEAKGDDDLAGMELVSARNQARELKRQLDAIMAKLGGW